MKKEKQSGLSIVVFSSIEKNQTIHIQIEQIREEKRVKNNFFENQLENYKSEKPIFQKSLKKINSLMIIIRIYKIQKKFINNRKIELKDRVINFNLFFFIMNTREYRVYKRPEESKVSQHYTLSNDQQPQITQVVKDEIQVKPQPV